MLLLSWALNNFVAKRAVRIQKGISTARDKRMGVLNELISAVCTRIHVVYAPTDSCIIMQVKFIKFFAWEDRWIGKVMNAREVEMQWMIKSASLEAAKPAMLTPFCLQVESILSALLSSGPAPQSWFLSLRSLHMLPRVMS